MTARISHWRPAVDVAVLELTSDPPAESKPVRLVTANDLWDHSFRALGFPAGYEQGVWASGVLRGRQADGWLQVEDTKQTGYLIAPGFSGGPVWGDAYRPRRGQARMARLVERALKDGGDDEWC